MAASSLAFGARAVHIRSVELARYVCSRGGEPRMPNS
jgi:hypothetical protein